MVTETMPQPSEGQRHRSANPVLSALIGAAAGLLGVALGTYVTVRQTGVQQAIADRENALRVAEVRRQIVLSAGDFDKPTVEVLLEHTLKPIDATGFEPFRRSMMDLIASKAASNDPRAPALEGTSATTVPPLEGQDPTQLVKLFEGPDRLRASNALVVLHVSKPVEVVDALLAGLVPESPLGNSYRINLYIAYTLGRLQPFWAGTQTQRQIIERLREQRSYRDPTFKLRVDQALANFRLRG